MFHFDGSDVLDLRCGCFRMRFHSDSDGRWKRIINYHLIDGRLFLCSGEACDFCKINRRAYAILDKHKIAASALGYFRKNCSLFITTFIDVPDLRIPVMVPKFSALPRPNSIERYFDGLKDDQIERVLDPTFPLPAYIIADSQGVSGLDVIPTTVPELPGDFPPLSGAFIPGDTVTTEAEKNEIVQSALRRINETYERLR